jgi:hypothetical protein
MRGDTRKVLPMVVEGTFTQGTTENSDNHREEFTTEDQSRNSTKQPARVRFADLPESVQRGCYELGIREVLQVHERTAVFFRHLSGTKTDLRLVIGAAVDRFTSKYGSPL